MKLHDGFNKNSLKQEYWDPTQETGLGKTLIGECVIVGPGHSRGQPDTVK